MHGNKHNLQMPANNIFSTGIVIGQLTKSGKVFALLVNRDPWNCIGTDVRAVEVG